MTYFFHKLGLIPQRLYVKFLSFVTWSAPVNSIENFFFGDDLNGENLKINSIPTGINFSEASFSKEHILDLVSVLDDFDGFWGLFGINGLSQASFTYLQCHIIINL